MIKLPNPSRRIVIIPFFGIVNYLGLKAEASEASFDAARLIPSLMITYIPRK